MPRTFDNAYKAYLDVPDGTLEEDQGFLELISLAQDRNHLALIFEQLTSDCLTTQRPRLMMLLARTDMIAPAE